LFIRNKTAEVEEEKTFKKRELASQVSWPKRQGL